MNKPIRQQIKKKTKQNTTPEKRDKSSWAVELKSSACCIGHCWKGSKFEKVWMQREEDYCIPVLQSCFS